jgi:polyisoprenoid-binding protein YceI
MTEHDDSTGSVSQRDLATLVADGTLAGHWVLDPAGSRAEFHIKHFWGAITVHGSFPRLSGEADVSADGTMTATLIMDATSVDTKNKQRDKHLRSADFFDIEHHPDMVLTVTGARPAGPATLASQGSLEAAGQARPVEFSARIEEATAQAVVLQAEIEVDRTGFGMTWSPLGMSAAMARGTVTARFVRP